MSNTMNKDDLKGIVKSTFPDYFKSLSDEFNSADGDKKKGIKMLLMVILFTVYIGALSYIISILANEFKTDSKSKEDEICFTQNTNLHGCIVFVLLHAVLLTFIVGSEYKLNKDSFFKNNNENMISLIILSLLVSSYGGLMWFTYLSQKDIKNGERCINTIDKNKKQYVLYSLTVFTVISIMSILHSSFLILKKNHGKTD
jgi:hypothetical protein